MFVWVTLGLNCFAPNPVRCDVTCANQKITRHCRYGTFAHWHTWQRIFFLMPRRIFPVACIFLLPLYLTSYPVIHKVKRYTYMCISYVSMYVVVLIGEVTNGITYCSEMVYMWPLRCILGKPAIMNQLFYSTLV